MQLVKNATLISPFQALLRTWPRIQRHATAASASSSQKPKIPENATPELPSGVNPGLQFSPSVYSASLFTVLWPLTTQLTHPQEAFSKYQTVTCAKTWGSNINTEPPLHTCMTEMRFPALSPPLFKRRMLSRSEWSLLVSC
jgi:hypothetical protein